MHTAVGIREGIPHYLANWRPYLLQQGRRLTIISSGNPIQGLSVCSALFLCSSRNRLGELHNQSPSKMLFGEVTPRLLGEGGLAFCFSWFLNNKISGTTVVHRNYSKQNTQISLRSPLCDLGPSRRAAQPEPVQNTRRSANAASTRQR